MESKATLISGGVGGVGVDPPLRKTDIFFVGSLALSVLIDRQFQSNVYYLCIRVIGYHTNLK